MPTLAGTALVPFTGDFGELTKGAAETATKIGESFRVGVGAPIAIVAATLGAVAVGSLDLASKFDSATAMMASSAGITVKQAQAIGSAFLATGGQSTFTAKQMMDAFGPVSGQLGLLMGGALTAADSLQVMRAAMDGAEATGQPLNDVTAALARTLVAFNISTASSSLVMDDLTNSSSALNQPITDIAETINKLKGRLGGAAPSLQQTSALMVDMAQNGVPARQAVSGVATAVLSLLDPSKTQAKLFEHLHLATRTSTGSFVGMDSIIGQLQPKFARMTQAQQLQTAATIFGKPSAEAMLAIIQQGPAAFDAQTAALGKAGSAQAGAAKATDTIAGAFDRLKTRVIDSGTAWGQKLEPTIRGFINFGANVVVPWLSTALPAAFAIVETWIQAHVVPAVQALLNVAVPALGTAMHIIGDAFGYVSGHAAIFAPLIAAIALSFAAFKVALAVGNLVNAASTGIAVLGAISGGASVGIGALTIGVDGLALGMVALSWPVLAIIAGVGALAVGMFELLTHFGAVQSFLSGPLGTAISGILAVLMPFIGIPMLLIGHWQAVVDFFKALPGRIVTAIGDATKWLVKTATDIWTGFIGALTTAWKGVSTWFHNLPGVVLKAIGDAGTWLVSSGLKAVGGLISGLNAALPGVWKFIVELPFRILALVVRAARWLFQTGTEVILGLVQGIAGAAVNLWHWFTTLPGEIWKLVNGADSWLIGTGVSIAVGLWSGIVSGATAVWKWMRSLPGELWKLLTGAETWLVATGVSILVGMLNGIGTGFRAVHTWFDNLPSVIAAFLYGAGTWLLQVGQDIINGLLSGLKTAWQGVVSWFSSIPGDIAGFFKSALGIRSPSIVMHGLGLDIMRGLSNGMAAGTAGVMGALTTATKGLNARVTLNGAVTGSLAGGGGSGGVAGGSSAPSSSRSIVVNQGPFYIHGSDPSSLAQMRALLAQNNAALVLALRSN